MTLKLIDPARSWYIYIGYVYVNIYIYLYLYIDDEGAEQRIGTHNKSADALFCAFAIDMYVFI